MTRVLFLTEIDPLGPSNGATIRGRAMLDALTEAYSVELAVVDSSGWAVTRHRRFRLPQELKRHSPSPPDAVHINGLPLAYAALAARTMGIPSVVDVCDSWVLRQLARMRRGDAAAILGLASAASLLGWPLRAASATIYINERDRTFDRRLTPSGPPSAVIPNPLDQRLLSLPLASGTEPEIVMLADWSYPPNIQGLRWLIRRVVPLLRETPIRLFGPSAPDIPLPHSLNYAGYTHEVGDAYVSARMALAPVLTGAGVKNKVLEAVTAGRPVITTPEGAVGIPALNSVVIANTPREFANAIMSPTELWNPAHLMQGRDALIHAATQITSHRLLDIYGSLL